MIKKFLVLFYIVAFSIFLVKGVNADVLLEGTKDTFNLLEDNYDKDEKFVFTATANFHSGQAAGLVFGAKEDEYYYVFNVDRFENRVKLLYFKKTTNGYDVKELEKEWYIGNNNMTESEKKMVNPKVATMPNVDLKVIITPEDDKVYAEFYADGIKRFGIDRVITLDEEYEGGNLGFNIFNSKVDFTNVEIGTSDYSYYSELYRQQYHFSQYKHWNNDPNGLVYFNGYYHLFFQHHPYNQYWGDMYWGHARSKDLVHWEQLPICVFPDENGYAWSGSARVYHKGENPEIDKWFKNDSGLIAFYTRDGGRQDQVIMSSDDEGMSWTKHEEYVIPQGIVGIHDRKISCRDPKVFQVERAGGKIWGMVIANMEDNQVYLLQSEDMLHWEYASGFTVFRPECVDVVYLTADDNTSHTVLTFEGREYLVGEFKYDEVNKEIYFEKYNKNGGIDIRNLTIEQVGAPKMDFGPDSYATQSFYIDDEASKYYGKTISISWFSGVPGAEASAESGAFAAVRSRWNGSGFTMPVQLGLTRVGDEYKLTQTPITLDNEDFSKSEIINVSDVKYSSSEHNLLSNVNTHQLEIIAEFDNPNQNAIEFKINVGEDEYTTIGWNKEEGYYVDRTFTSDGGINFHNYHRKYISGPVDTTTSSFYILSDNGGVEVFCEDFSVPFYVLTLSSVYSTQAELNVSGEVTIKNLEVNEIKSVFKDEQASDKEGIVYISKDNIRLDLDLTNSENVLFYTTLNETPTWNIKSGEDVIDIVPTDKGVSVSAKTVGEAVIELVCGNVVKEINVKVETGSSVSDIEFEKEGIVSGKWYQTPNGLIGQQLAGDGHLLSTEKVSDCFYTAQFDLGSGAAAALILRASSDMQKYILVNYDKNGKVVKAWTHERELFNRFVGDVDLSNITLSVKLYGNVGTIILNSNVIGEFTLNENDPKEGYLGLNVCATEATFKAVTLQKTNFDYELGDLTFLGNVKQHIVKINNITLKNSLVNSEFYSSNGREITISQKYFETLKEIGEYQFEVVGQYSSFIITIDVKSLPKVELNDIEIKEKENLNIYLGNIQVEKVELNGVELKTTDYIIKNLVLTIPSDLLIVGSNTLKINEEEIIITVIPTKTTDFEVEVEKPTIPDEDIPTEEPTIPGDDVPPTEPTNPEKGCRGNIGLSIFGIVMLGISMIFFRKKKVS